MHGATISQQQHEANDIYSLWFQAPSLTFTPGQYIALNLPPSATESHFSNRYFTISSAPGRGSFRITTRYSLKVASAFKIALFSLTPRDVIQISDSQGDFVLPKDRTIPLLFVALGLGITPYLAMAEWLVEKGERREITLIRQAKVKDELLGGEIFARAGVHVIDHIGRLEADTILTASDITSRILIYIAGPERGVRALEGILKERGIRSYQIVTDAFLGYEEH